MDEILTKAEIERIKAVLRAQNNLIKNREIANKDWFSDGEGDVLVNPTIQGVAFADLSSNTPRLREVFDGEGNLSVKQKILHAGPVTSDTGTATITATGRWEVLGLHADANMAAVAADRDINIVITVPVIVSGVVLRVVSSSAITLSTNQNGALFFPSNHSHWTNDNAVIARVADENPFPMTFELGSAFQVVNDNLQIGDTIGIELWYRLGT